jgi:hypothetical protein
MLMLSVLGAASKERQRAPVSPLPDPRGGRA